jgi:hypothetical protein
MNKVLASIALAVGAALLMGCEGDPTFTAKSNAPPGATADYFEDRSTDKRTIRITEGLAFALECSDPKNRPCAWEDSATGDPSIATARRAYGDLDQKLVSGSTLGQSSQRTRMMFVVTAHKPGETFLTVKTGMTPVDIKIEVLPAK